jgi:hypothetical protein
MTKSKVVLLCLLFLLFSTFSLRAQVGVVTIDLKNILQQISEQHQINFDYIETEISFFSLIPPPKELPLAQKIAYLKKQTQLVFKVIDNKYYTITSNQKSNKSLCGYIIDSQNEAPIENVIVQIINTTIATATNKKGYFELPDLSLNPIEIRHIGYQNILINKDNLNQCPTIKLAPVTLPLEEVITQRYLTSGIDKQIDGTIIIKPRKFGILPGLIEPDVLQTMQQIPGIYSTDETISNLNVRGGTHDQNLFLWNGIRMYQTGHFFGLISAFNPSLAHTIAITKNGTSAFYDDGVSSLVDISSHSKLIEKSQNSFSINLISAAFYSKIKASDKANIEVSARRSFTDAIATPTYKNYRKRIFQNTIITNVNNTLPSDTSTDEDFYFYDFSLQYQQKIGLKNELTLDGIAIQNQLAINQSSLLENRNSTLSQSNFGGNIGWKTTWNEYNSSQILFNASYYNLDSKNESIKINQVLNQQNNVLDIGFQIKNTHQISTLFNFNNGYQYNEKGVTNYDKINSPFFSRNIKAVLRSHAIILEGEYQSRSKTTFVKTGIRANYFQGLSALVFEPRLQITQKLNPNLSIEILGEQKSQTISQVIDLQADFLGIEKRRWELANNNNIPIQKSNQIALGASFKNNDWLISLDNFYKKVTGITSSSQGFQNQFELLRAIGDYSIVGSEVLIQRNFGSFYTWLSYGFNQNQYIFETLSKDNFPNNYQLIHNISWAAIYECEKWKMALGSKWHSGKPYTSPASNSLNIDNPSSPTIQYNSPNDSQLKSYLQLNFSASRNWTLSAKVKLIASFSVLNMLDTKNSINRFYRINTTNNTIESVDTYGQEVTQNINLKFLF